MAQQPTVFAELASIEALTAAWAKVLANGGGPGGDGESIADFAGLADIRLQRLAFELSAGLYRPGPVRRLSVPKASGKGMRGLSIPCVIDRVAQTAAAAALTPRLEPEFEDVSFGYRPGRSVAQAVARVARLRREGYQWVVDGDIRAFFDDVPHDVVLATLGRHVPDPRLIQLVGLWLESFSGDGKGLAQGSPLSPLLSNLHLDALDEAMEGTATRIVRFADDFVVLTRSRPKAEAALARVERLLASLGLEINRDKTRIVPFEEAFTFLGHVFVRSMVRLEEDAPPRRPIPPHAIPPGPAAIRMAAVAAHSADIDEAIVPVDAALPPHPVSAPAAAEIVARAEVDPLEPQAADRDAEDFALGLAPLYLLEPGSRLVADGESFAVHAGGRVRLLLPAGQIGRIDLGPEAEADDRALRLAAAHGVPVHLLDGVGGVAATLGAVPHDGELHLAQARLSLDPAARLVQARLFAATRLRNEHALLKRLNRRRRDPQVAEACDELMMLRRRAIHADTIDRARGFEGAGAARYWPALGRCLDRGWTLTRRLREGSRDPVNAALDWAASLLARDIRAAVLRAGLHPGFGAMHAEGRGREPAVYDLIEAFRAPLAEGFVVYLFNNRILDEADFAAREGGMRFDGPGGRRFITAYEHWLARAVKSPRTGRMSVWRGLLLAEARAYAAAIRRGEPFTPQELDF